MPRRASSSPSPLLWIAAILVLAFAGIGGHFLFKDADDSYRTIPPLEVQSYLDNANSLRGNVYKVTGEVLNSLAWSPSQGRLFSFQVDAGEDKQIIPVLVPVDFNKINIQRGQQFQLQLEVGDKGILTAREIRKA